MDELFLESSTTVEKLCHENPGLLKIAKVHRFQF